MPPKPIVTRDDILNASITLIREKGSDSVNARSIAETLNCSTKPLFRVYENMAELKRDVYNKAVKYYESFLFEKRVNEDDAFLSMGLNYIRFAFEEKQLFKFIFLSNHVEIKNLNELTDSPDTHKLVEFLAILEGLHEKAAKELFVELWLLVHGIATLLATNPCKFEDYEIENLLVNAYAAKAKHLKMEVHHD